MDVVVYITGRYNSTQTSVLIFDFNSLTLSLYEVEEEKKYGLVFILRRQEQSGSSRKEETNTFICDNDIKRKIIKQLKKI